MFIIILLLMCAVFLTQCDKSHMTREEEEPVFACGNASLDGPTGRGTKLFKQNCAVCHTLTDQKLTGPGLSGILDRAQHPAKEWIKNYILSSSKVIKSGDPYARKIHEENAYAQMTEFEGILTDNEIDLIISYMTSRPN